MSAALRAALERAEGSTGGPAELGEALRAVTDALGPFPTESEFGRCVAAAMRALALSDRLGATETGREAGRRLEWTADELAMRFFHDWGAHNRDYIEQDVRRRRALRRTLRDGVWDHYVPRMHVPLDLATAGEVMAPYLARLDRAREAEPTAHLHPVWEMLTKPQPPFDTVVRRWLAERDGAAVERALALHAMSREGVQRVHDLEGEVMSQLSDPHPLVAAHAGQLLGGMMIEPERILGDVPAWGDVLDRIAALPAPVRRPVAGGFLNGVDVDMDGPLRELERQGVAAEAMEAWVFAILDGTAHEPYLPGVQAFWFPLHEAWSQRADLAHRLIDAGEPWLARMCATEDHPTSDAMLGVLGRLEQEDGRETPGGAG